MNRSIATFLAMVLSTAPAWAQLQSPRMIPAGAPAARETRAATPASFAAAAERFWDCGYEMAHARNITGPQADEAIILLAAAKILNSQTVDFEPLVLKLATRSTGKDYSGAMVSWLQKYVNEAADRAVVADVLRYLLNRLPAPAERKALLDKIAFRIKNKNAAIDSELATALGLLALEQGDKDQAKYYLVQAYTNNRFNRTAFAKLNELAPNEIGPEANLEHLRLLVQENPLDLDSALAFAGYAGQLQLFSVAGDSYLYCHDLFKYLYPSERLPQKIYLPCAVSYYNVNTPEGWDACLRIAKDIRDGNRFDIILEALAGRAALKLNKPDEARQIFDQAEQTAVRLLSGGLTPAPTPAGTENAGATPDANTPPPTAKPPMEPVQPPNARQLAWFYCFADANTAKALDWANKAYSAEPNSPSTRSLLAYALSLNNHLDLVKQLSASAEQGQIADLVRARVQLAAGKKSDAIQTLRASIAQDAGSLMAEAAKELLKQQGVTYIPEADPKHLNTFLTSRLGKTVVPDFLPPDRMLDVQFSTRDQDLSYGRELEGVITITNKSSEPLVITDHSLFQGNIRISAHVGGDLTQDIPNLVSETIRTDLTVPPGRSLVHSVRLSTGELRELLLASPQATLDLDFTLYLDPVITAKGEISNRLVDLKPVTISRRRPAVQVTPESLRSRISLLTSAQDSQKIPATLLLTGLLQEQRIMAEKGNLYIWQYADWLPAQWRSALMNAAGPLLAAGTADWVVKVNTMADMLSLPLDQQTAEAVLKNINNSQWPVRLMAVYLLGQNSPNTVSNVLDWVIQNDKDELVRSMALSLQAAARGTAAPQPPTAQPTPAVRP